MHLEKPSYKPIYLIFAYLILSNLVIQYENFAWEQFLVHFMASFFIVFSFFKMLDLEGFAEGYAAYDIIAKRIYVYGYIYPFIELYFGLAYLVNGHVLWLNLAVFIIMSISSIGVMESKLKKQQVQCACVGTVLKVPLGNITIIEDLLMAVMALGMIFT